MVVDIDGYMSLIRSIRRGYTIEALNMVLDVEVLEANNCWRKRGNLNREEAGLSVLAPYTQVENGLGLMLRYLEAS